MFYYQDQISRNSPATYLLFKGGVADSAVSPKTSFSGEKKEIDPLLENDHLEENAALMFFSSSQASLAPFISILAFGIYVPTVSSVVFLAQLVHTLLAFA